MTSDPRAALAAFVAALETHLELAAVRRGDDDPAVVTAYQKVADAFVAYDDALLDAFGEVTPLDIYTEDEDDEYVDEDDLEELDDLDDDLDDEFDDDDSDDDDDDDGDDLDDEDDDEDDDTADDDLDDVEGASSYVGLDDGEYDVDDDADRDRRA